MANYANLLATIAANIYTNHDNEVSAAMVKASVDAVANALIAGGFLNAGRAYPDDAAVSPDANVFFLAADAGTYTNKGGIVIDEGEVAYLTYNGSWNKVTTGMANKAKVDDMDTDMKIIEKNVGFTIQTLTGISTGNTVNYAASIIRACYFLPIDNLAYVRTWGNWKIYGWALVATPLPSVSLYGIVYTSSLVKQQYLDVKAVVADTLGDPKYLALIVTDENTVTGSTVPNVEFVTDTQRDESDRLISLCNKTLTELGIGEYCYAPDEKKIFQYVSAFPTPAVSSGDAERVYREVVYLPGAIYRWRGVPYYWNGTDLVPFNAIPKAVRHPYPFEVGGVTGLKNGPVELVDSTNRIRIDLPFDEVAGIRFVQGGWVILGWAVYAGDLPTSRSYGDYNALSTAIVRELGQALAGVTLTFTPERVIFLIAKGDDSNLEGVTSIDDILVIDKVNKSLSGREMVVLGDSESAIVNHNCWARVLSGRCNRMAVTGFFEANGGTGWLPQTKDPHVLAQWNDCAGSIITDRPIVVIGSGGNDVEDHPDKYQGLSYDDMLSLCDEAIESPDTLEEWMVYTLRQIVSDKPMARIYLVSNYYAGSTSAKDAWRRGFREELRALCDYFSITLIDLTRNSQIRGFLENDSESSGYHIYTDDGVHATRVAGRYLIYHRIMEVITRMEQHNV